MQQYNLQVYMYMYKCSTAREPTFKTSLLEFWALKLCDISLTINLSQKELIET